MIVERTGFYRQPDRSGSRRFSVNRRFFWRKAKVRHYFQAVVLILTLAAGVQFGIYVYQISGGSDPTLARPAGVEGFLPIGALISWKRFLLTGVWDDIHPAAMVIFGFAIGISFLVHKAFCSWFCPIGTISEACWRLGQRLFEKTIQPLRWLDIPLRGVKYLLLGFFFWITWTMSVQAITAFIASPYYKVSDVKMLYFFLHMSITTAIVLIMLLTGSVFIKNFWCRYFCPYGALTGLVAMLSPMRIRRSESACTGCSQCSRACPHRIDVMNRNAVVNAECSACLDCVAACPAQDALRFGTAGIRNGWSPVSIGSLVLGVFLIVYLTAVLTGHWQSALPAGEFKQLLLSIERGLVPHPGI